MKSQQLMEGPRVLDGGLRPGPECTASSHSVKQMVAVKEMGAGKLCDWLSQQGGF